MWRSFFNVSDPYNSQQAVDDSLDALKFVSNWCVTNKMIKKFFTALYVDYNVL